jgi:hypothetical protein
MMYVGNVYAYPRPGCPGLYDYVGKTEDGDMDRRHGEHLKGDLRFDEYLRSLPVPTYPVELIRVQHEDKDTWLFMLFWMEMHFMFEHQTYRPRYPEHGGWNFALPHPFCYTDMSRLGGGAHDMSSEAKERQYEGARLGGHTQGFRNVENGHLARVRSVEGSSKGGLLTGGTHEMSPEAQERMHRGASKAGSSSCQKRKETGQYQSLEHRRVGRLNQHNRWHVARGIVNPSCSLCILQEIAA